MTTAAELRALAEEVEGLSGPSRDADARIMRALWPVRTTKGGSATHTKGDMKGLTVRVEPYTASIDAAASLMPEGWTISSVAQWGGTGSSTWLVSVRSHNLPMAKGEARTEPLARCAAALRARAALLDDAAATAPATP